MLLTLAKPHKSEFEFKTHDYSPTYSESSPARFEHSHSSHGLLPAHRNSISSVMGTPHRGLPPPSAMTLPDPGRGGPPPSLSSSMGALPQAPSQWQGAEDGMKNWLAAKSEEEKRKQEEEKRRQEEEKTRQMTLEIEKRKIEFKMLETSLQGGIPPHLIPIIFAGVGGGSLATVSAEWIQSYQASLQSAQQQQQQQHAHAHAQGQLSPDLRRETRLIGQPPPGPFAPQPQTPQSVLPPTSVLPGQPLPSQSQQTAFGPSYASGAMSPRARAAAQSGHVGPPTSISRPPPQSQLPRLTTNETYSQQTPTAATNVQVQQTQQSQSGQQEQSSPSIYFHHWVPPTSQHEKTTSANLPATPSGKYRTSSPSALSRKRAISHASDPDYASSPKKRKAQGGHQAPPPPTSAPQSYTSPSFSHISTSSASTPGRRGHTRAHSDMSSRGDGHVPSMSRRTTVSSQTHTDAGAQQQRDAPDHHYHAQPRGREEAHHPQPEHAYAPQQQRNEARGEQPAQATPTMAFQSETRRPSGPHQHQDRGTAPFPKWEAGDQ